MLDLAQINRQVGEATRSEGERHLRREEQTTQAVALVRGFDADGWAAQVARIRGARTAWQMAHCIDPPCGAIMADAPPEQYIVVAVDGSQVAPDRHEGIGGCYLLNASRIVLSYGDRRRARLDAVPQVLTLDDEDEGDGETQVEAALSARRFGYEMQTVGDLVCEVARANPGVPVVALVDDPLIAWHLYDKAGQDQVKREALDTLTATLAQARECGVPVAGYVSDSRARDVVSALRVVLCPEDTVACSRCRVGSGGAATSGDDVEERPCRALSLATDTDLFTLLLKKGERSPIFTSREQATGFSKVLDHYPDEDKIDFFYLNVGHEIARVEIPRWVADDPCLVSRVQAVCFDQATKGGGYPVALAEAHERAIVRGADREAFLNMVRRSFVQSNLKVAVTRKALAKRTRAV